jgi:chromosome segregation ATPase
MTSSDDHAPKPESPNVWQATSDGLKLHELTVERDALQKRLDELLSYMPKVPTQAYEKELAKQNLELQKRCDELESQLKAKVSIDTVFVADVYETELAAAKAELIEALNEKMKLETLLKFAHEQNEQANARIKELCGESSGLKMKADLVLQQRDFLERRIKELEEDSEGMINDRKIYLAGINKMKAREQALVEALESLSFYSTCTPCEKNQSIVEEALKKHRGDL